MDEAKECREYMDEGVARVMRMEMYLDALQAALRQDRDVLRNDPALAAMLEELTAYYESPAWMADYERDSRGGFPCGLKRGVLSEDAIYDFLTEADRPAEGQGG